MIWAWYALAVLWTLIGITVAQALSRWAEAKERMSKLAELREHGKINL